MANGKKSFVLYTDLIEITEELTDKEAGLLFKTILRYVNDRNPEIPKEIKLAFIPIKQDLKRDLKKYEAQVERINRINEERKRKKEEQEHNDIVTTSSKVEGVNVNDNVNVNVNDNVLDKSNTNNKENTTHTSMCLKEKSTTSRFIPPTLEQVQAYCLERNNLVDPNKWFDFYQSKGWMVGKNKMKDWKAAVRTWEKESGFKNNPNEPNDNGGFTEL